MNKKGFTLAEVLAVIVILGIIITIAATSITAVVKRSKESALNRQIEYIESAAKNYYISANYPDIGYVTVEELYKNGYLKEENINNPVNDEKIDGCIIIGYSSNQYKYNYSKKCENYLMENFTSKFESIKYSVKNIYFKNGIDNNYTDYTYYDVSQEQDGSIIAYQKRNPGNTSMYDIFVEADSTIFANPNSSNLFKNFESVEAIDFANFNTSKVINMSYMFYYCFRLNSIDVSRFNTSNVIDMSHMFNLCYGLRALDVCNFNTSNVTNMSGMFASCRKITILDVSNFDTSKVTNMSGMFYECSGLTEITLGNFNTSIVNNMSGMFGYHSNFVTIDISSFDTSKVTNMSHMFWDCKNLKNIYVGNGWNTNAVTNSENMFESSYNLPNYNGDALDKTNANTSSTGYLKTKV